MIRFLGAALVAVIIGCLGGHAEAACPTGISPPCNADTLNNEYLAFATNDQAVQTRVWNLWNGQCANIESEASSTAGHTYRVAMCNSVAAQKVPLAALVSSILYIGNPTIAAEILANPSFNQGGAAAGDMVDLDVNTAIDSVMTVTVSSQTLTATGSSGSVSVTVSSGTGLFPGELALCGGCAAGSTIAAVSGTTVYLTSALTAALSSSPIAFTYAAGLPTRAWN